MSDWWRAWREAKMLSNFINKMYFIFSFQDLFLYHLNISDSFLSCLQVASYMLK